MARRSKFVSPWHLCTRCGRKTHLTEMTRQRGILICPSAGCFDNSLLGDREATLARAIERVSSSSNNEMLPDPRLSDQASSTDEDIIF